MSERVPVQVAKTVTIANGASLSDAEDTEGLLLCGIHMPADWTAASLTFQACTTLGGTFNNVYDSGGSEKTVTTSDDRYILLEPSEWAGTQFLKVRSGTSGSAVNQGAERIITLVFRSS